ncbi:type II toxin-antitoxin system PemK/MazF family toxin [Blastomonas sp. CCH1-A6]|uniref:type II toxin-antitoxin system PemK/MazF family toxin n=2 Tax=unclassified Blastomonas TaxID=2626550 RepID=UPI001924E198
MLPSGTILKTTSTMPFEPADIAFGAVVLVPFPFTDQATSKRRPAVVISSANYHASRPDVILMAITSQLRASAAFGEVWLKEWQAAGLLKPSAVKPLVATLERVLIIRQLGHLAEDDAKALRAAIADLIG